MFELGRVLPGGLPELRADPERGVYLLQRALIKGVPTAAGLGQLHEQGLPRPGGGEPVIPVNLQEALTLYQQAQKAGVAQMAPAIERVRLRLSGKGARSSR